MKLNFDTRLSQVYANVRQNVKLMSEDWVEQYMYCPCCTNPTLFRIKNNAPAADFVCENCGEYYEVKATGKQINDKIVDGAYKTMIERINSLSNPNLLVLQYTERYKVNNLTLVPKYFFTPGVIEKRKALSDDAIRKNWVGCYILYGNIPKQGKISVIADDEVNSVIDVYQAYQRSKELSLPHLQSRSWMLDVLNCVNDIQGNEFTLQDMYLYIDILQKRYSQNNNIKEKIRQQLQVLRDKGVIEFLGNGNYRKKV